MPCDMKRLPTQTPDDRKREILAGIAKLQAGLAAGSVKVVVGAGGSVAFQGWAEGKSNRISDLCAFRKLQASGSPELRKALATAEARAGRTVDRLAIGAGTHSHDGGHTWHPGH